MKFVKYKVPGLGIIEGIEISFFKAFMANLKEVLNVR